MYIVVLLDSDFGVTNKRKRELCSHVDNPIRRISIRCKFIPVSNPSILLMKKEPNGDFFKVFRFLKIENAGEQELARAQEKSTGL
jgi:hypothetical protein